MLLLHSLPTSLQMSRSRENHTTTQPQQVYTMSMQTASFDLKSNSRILCHAAPATLVCCTHNPDNQVWCILIHGWCTHSLIRHPCYRLRYSWIFDKRLHDHHCVSHTEKNEYWARYVGTSLVTFLKTFAKSPSFLLPSLIVYSNS